MVIFTSVVVAFGAASYPWRVGMAALCLGLLASLINLALLRKKVGVCEGGCLIGIGVIESIVV